jgi:hypothetical protein
VDGSNLSILLRIGCHIMYVFLRDAKQPVNTHGVFALIQSGFWILGLRAIIFVVQLCTQN